MEYYGIPHDTVELNPLWKRRMAFTSSKIPVAEVDGEKVGTLAIDYVAFNRNAVKKNRFFWCCSVRMK